MKDGSNQHNNANQHDDAILNGALRTLGLALGVGNGSYQVFLHEGAASKISVQLEVVLTGRDAHEQQDCDESIEDWIRMASGVIRVVWHPLLKEFVRANLEGQMCEHMGDFGELRVQMRKCDVKCATMHPRANLAV